MFPVGVESIAQAVEDSGQCSDNKYADLYAQNNDFIGWIRIADTVIDYPVMQSKDSPNFYLDHNFNKEYSRFGVPYMQENCNLQSDNIVIYGHNMKNKSMFNELTKYKDKDFYNTHRYIQLFRLLVIFLIHLKLIAPFSRAVFFTSSVITHT